MSHTGEPWAARIDPNDDEYLDGCTAKYIIESMSGETIAYIKKEDDARRIVACVKACAGMRTDILETVSVQNSLRIFDAELKEAAKERDQLVLAEEGAKEAFGTLVEQKRVLEDEVRRFSQTIATQQDIIRSTQEQRAALLSAMKHIEGAAMSIDVERGSIAKAAHAAIASAS